MIGTRAAISATVAVVGVAVLFSPRQPDPGLEIAARRLIDDRAEAAASALDELRAAVEPGLEAAREGVAAVLTGDADPGPRLEAAGDLIAEADERASATLRAVAALEGARRAWRPDQGELARPVQPGELASIGTQLAAAAGAADDFADTRRRGLSIPSTLDDALAALQEGNVDAADALVRGARADHRLVAGWESPPPTLPVWIETSDAMISAVEEIVAAFRAGDASAAEAAADDFAALADDAETADRALRIALGEGGSAVTAAPLARLAAVLGRIESSRAAIAGLASDGR